MRNHARKNCAFKRHELANTNSTWDGSTKGKLWASHGKPHLTIGYAIPGYAAIQHSDGVYPKANPYAKQHYLSNSSTGTNRQNNYNHNRDNNNNRDNSAGRNNNREHSVERNTNSNSFSNYNNRDRSTDRNNRDNSVGRNDNNNSDPNTVFIVFCGIYQFTRFPFGLTGAPSYFQQTIATVVLAGLLYFTCEVYIDDVNVYAKDSDEFLARLREVFQRFRHHKVYLKASKCYLGYSELNYLGTVISSEGLQMSQDRFKQVVDFPTPQLSKQLKSFLGITNYFRDHVRYHSMIVKPLHSLLTNYCKTKKITWTAEALNAFNRSKRKSLNVQLCIL
jgi:Reverse transcriptase (RNA-dependent DNA polymerase)